MTDRTEQYSVNIAWSDEDGGYVARVPEFPNLYAFGESAEGALAEAKTALAGYIEIYQEQGRPLPEPTKRPVRSGQLRLRMPRSLHDRLVVMAETEGVSLNQLIVSLVSEAVGQGGRSSAGGTAAIFAYFLRAPKAQSLSLSTGPAAGLVTLPSFAAGDVQRDVAAERSRGHLVRVG